MRQGKAIRKIPGGKLIRIDTLSAERMYKVKITGDFFLYPEDALDEIEHILSNAPLPLKKEALVQALKDTLTSFDAQLVGASAEDIVDVLAEAVK